MWSCSSANGIFVRLTSDAPYMEMLLMSDRFCVEPYICAASSADLCVHYLFNLAWGVQISLSIQCSIALFVRHKLFIQ